MLDTLRVLLKTFCHHPLRIAGRFALLCSVFVLVTVDYLFLVALRHHLSLRHAKARWLQRGSRRVLRVLNASWQVTGQVPQHGLLVSNHLSYLDILVMAAFMPATFVAKQDVRGWPLFGWFARMAGTIFVHRTRRHDTARATAEIRQALDEGALLVLFAEGTSSDGTSVLPFKSALLEPAARQAHELHAGCISYTLTDGSVADEVCYWRDMTLFTHLLNLLGKRSVFAHVALTQIQEAALNRKQLAEQLHSEVMRLKRLVAA